MPNSRRLAFKKQELPSYLTDEDCVFYCEPTGEAFMTYREYCERIIQCNSLIWTDTISGKSDFTYTEAMESEIKSLAALKILPKALHIPVLYLASIARNKCFEEMVHDVFYFVEDRYFVGETVQFLSNHDDNWKEGIVTKVTAPSLQEFEDLRNEATLIERCNFYPPPPNFVYEVECSDGYGIISTVKIPSLKRPPEVWTQEKARCFLKHFTVLKNSTWLIDKGVMRKFKIPCVKFREFYAGSPPVFPVMRYRLHISSVVKKMKKGVQNGLSQKCGAVMRNKKTDRLLTKQDRKRMKKLLKEGTINKRRSDKIKQTDIKTYFSSCNQGEKINTDSAEESFGESDVKLCGTKSTKYYTEDLPDVEPLVAVPGPSSTCISTGSKRLRVRGTFFKKGKQLRITGDGRLEGMSKHSTVMGRKGSVTEKDREIEHLRNEKNEQAVLEGFRLHAERLRIKAKLEEDKLQFAKFLKEWRKKREDLECEDLKPLPVPHQINCSIPNHLFGDFVMVLEFLNSFHDFLKLKSYIPGGISLDLLERALIEREIAGPLHDIICMFLNSIFECQAVENEIAKTNGISVDITLEDIYNRKKASEETGKDCLDATGWCETFQGVSIQELDLTPLTVSEILRLHLLGSGGRNRDFSQWLRQRPTNFDDPIYWLRTEHTSVLHRLSQQHICELSVEEKLTILSCLMNEILAYTQVRDLLDDRGEQMRAAKAEVRALEIAELKMQKEATAKRIQNKRTAKLLRLKGESSGKSNTQLLKHQKDVEIEQLKIEKEISKLKMEIQKKQNKVLPLLMKHQLHPIGSDRAHRHFWLFSSVPGLFVEYAPFELGPCLPKPTPLRTEDRGDVESHVRKLFEQGQNCSSDKENDTSDGELAKPPSSPNKKMLAEQNNSVDLSSVDLNEKGLPRESEETNVPQFEFLICTANNVCPVHCQLISRSNWSFFSKPDDVEMLLDSLNERGIRESDLKRAMMREQERIKESIASCPLQKLSSSKFADQEPRKSTRNSVCYKPEIANMDFPFGTPVMNIMESVLRDSILEMENKITTGCLGVLKVQDRSAWRLAIEKGDYDQQCEKLVWGFPKSCLEKDSEQSKLIKEDEMNVESFSLDERPSESPNELYPRKDDEKWNGIDSETDVNMINTGGDKQGGGEEVCTSNRANERESSVHSFSTSDVDSYTEEPDNNTLHEEVDGRRDCDSRKSDSQNSLLADDFNGPSENEVISSAVQADEKVEVQDNDKKISVEVSHRNKVKNLARAILQLGQSVDPKFLLKPLADDDGEKSRLQMKYWEASLMNAINFSQLFIHQFTLDRSINWSKSILRMPCRICRRRGEPETMISCSECQKRYHYKCTNTKDSEIHKESWQCPFCSREYVPKSSKSKKRKSYYVKSERNEVLGNSAPERKSVRLACQKCALSNGHMVTCVSCSKTFHANCLNPDLRLPPHQQEYWHCNSCKPATDSNPSDAESQYSNHEDSDEAPGRERRICASATIAKIASYAKRLRSRSWDEEDADEVTSVCSSSTGGSRKNSRCNHPGQESPIRRSSRRADCISESLPLDNAVLQHLLDEMIHHEDSWPFLRPVRKSEVPDYHLYIKKPMDLGTIKYKLNTAEYRNNYDFVVDTLLVFENCFMYNSSQTAVYKCGVAMLKYFKRRCKELGLMEYGETEISLA